MDKQEGYFFQHVRPVVCETFFKTSWENAERDIVELQGSVKLHGAVRAEDDTGKIRWASCSGVWAQTTNCKRNLWEVKGNSSVKSSFRILKLAILGMAWVAVRKQEAPLVPVSGFGYGPCGTQSWHVQSGCAYNNSHGIGMVTAPCRYSPRLVFQVISSFTSYGLILKGFSVIGLSLAMFNPLIFSTCISLLRGKANSGWQWKRDHIQVVIVSMSKTKV